MYEANGKFEFSFENRELTLLTSEYKRNNLKQSDNFIEAFYHNAEVLNKLKERKSLKILPGNVI